MKVSTAIELLKELPLDAEICAQWYDQDDMSRFGEELTDDVWQLAVAIFNKYEFPDMMYAVEQAIAEARTRITKGEI